MSKLKAGVSGTRKSSRHPTLRDEQSAHCSTSNFQTDVTYGDCDETVNVMPGSLATMSPSSRGHTMKECEEQLSHLHKENFNLKLRIYFLEERLGHRGPGAAPGGTDDFAVWEATLRAEADSLRAELAEKQQLLCHAASAIDLVERKHGDEVEGLRAERLALEGQLTQLQQASNERCRYLEDEVTHVSELCSRQQEELTSLAAQCHQRANVASVGTQCADTATAAAVRQRDQRIEELAKQLQAKGQQVSDAEQRIRGLEEALCEIQPEIQIKVQELRERDNIIEEKQNQIEQQNRVLVEIQITLAEKQRLIDALNSTISARDVKVAQLESELAHAQATIRAGETRLEEEARELSRARGENEMLKTQLKRMNRSKEERERESPRRRSNLHSRESVSPRNKSLIEEAIEGIWSAPIIRGRDEFLPFEEKENLWKLNETKEKPDKSQQYLDFENKLDRKSDRYSEENYLKLEKEHQRGCEAIQVFITRIKHLANENEHLKRDSKRNEKKLSEMKLELKELRDSYNKAKWEARQLQADATGVPGTLADVKDMTEEENERLWAEIEDKNKKYAQLSLEMETQVKALLTSLKEKESLLCLSETKLATFETKLSAREKSISELEEKVFQLQCQIRSLLDSQPTDNITNSSMSLDTQPGLPNNIMEDLESGLKQSMLNLHKIFGSRLWNDSTIDNLQECLNIIFKKREIDIVSLQQQVECKDLQLKVFTDKAVESGTNSVCLSVTNESVPINFTQHLHLGTEHLSNGTITSEQSRLSADLACKGMLLALEQQVFTSANEQTNLRREVECLRKQLHDAGKEDKDGSALTVSMLEYNKLKDELRVAEVTKKNATNVCGLLVGRLEELAGFLVSLLRHPERLGNLETSHCRFIKQAVQRSVNLSRQLSMSISQHEENDCSRQATNSLLLQSIPNMNFSLVGQYLDGVNETSSALNDIAITSCSTNTLDELCGFNSNEAERTLDESLSSPAYDRGDNAEVIERLRSQVDTLKLEIKQRDIELHCLTQEHNLIKLSSPLFDRTDGAEEHPLSSLTFYSNYHTANKENGQTGNLKSSKPRGAKEMVIVEIRADDDCHDNSTDHIQLPEPTRASNVSTQPQLVNTSVSVGKHSRGEPSGDVATLHTQHDATLALSESETWSEPDRQISFARIGLPEERTCLGSPSNASFRHHHSRTLQELDESSESSQETTREINRTPGKRRSDAFELRRLQARLRGLEQVNEALRAELTILHQITPVSNLSSCRNSPNLVENNEKDTSDMLTNCKIVPTNESRPPASNLEQLDNPVVIPSHLLEQIKHQREKLESSLFHNDFIRQQLEEVFLSATGRPTDVKSDDGTPLTRIEGSTQTLHETQSIVSVAEAKLQAAEDKAKQLEEQLQGAERLLAESREQAKIVAQAETLCSETHQTLSVLQDQVNDLELQLKKKVAEIITKEGLVAELEDKLLKRNTEINRIVQEMADLKVESEKKVAQAEERVIEVKNSLLSKVEDIENEIFLYEKKNKVTEGELKEAKDNLNEAILQREESNKIIEMMKIEFSSKILVYEEAQKSLEIRIERSTEESNREMERRSRKLEEAEKQLKELRWAYKAEVERKVRDAERLGNDIEAGLRRQVDIAERRTREIEVSCRERESDLRLKVQESEKRFLDTTVALRQQQDEARLSASQAELDRTRLANEKLRLEQEVRRHETREAELMQEQSEAEARLSATQEQLSEQILVLRRQRNELEQRVLELETANEDLKFQLDRMTLLKDSGSYCGPWGAATSPPSPGHLRPEPCTFPRDTGHVSGRGWHSEGGRARSPDSVRSPLSSLVLQRGFGRQYSDFSDYVSEDQEYETVVTTTQSSSVSSYWIKTVRAGAEPTPGRINSPDLGIESDQGRFSSLEANASPGAERCPTTADVDGSSSAVQKYRHGSHDHNCKAIKEKNIELARELCQTRRVLEETLAQLTASNHRKQNVEKAICKQLQKTHSILMKTRGNLQSEHLMLCDDQT